MKRNREVRCRCDAGVSKADTQMFFGTTQRIEKIKTKHCSTTQKIVKMSSTRPRQCLDYVSKVSTRICKQHLTFLKVQIRNVLKCHYKTLTYVDQVVFLYMLTVCHVMEITNGFSRFSTAVL